jgi:hypothetical protein
MKEECVALHFPPLSNQLTRCLDADLTEAAPRPTLGAASGGRSSMVEPQIVVLAVAGSSPVGHPTPSQRVWFFSPEIADSATL